MLEALQNTQFSQWLLVSEWGYPIFLTLHSLGLAMLVGVLIIIDLRVLGFVTALPLPPIKRLMTIVWIAFAVNATSGSALFAADAVKFFHSPTFQLKIASIAIGVTLAALISSNALNVENSGSKLAAPPVAKTLAVISIIVWIAAIGFGRYMAYE